jgi:hypothetical protein
MRWSQLQKLIYNVWSDDLHLQIHTNAYALSGTASVGRYWITLGKEIIWDVPRDFPEEKAKGKYNFVASEITEVIRAYLDTPREELLSRVFETDRWGLIDIFRVSDRRLGRKSLEQLEASSLSGPAKRILEARLKIKAER